MTAKYHEYIKEAFSRGYRIDQETGNIISPTGKIRENKLFGSQRYASFAMTKVFNGVKKTASFPVHKFAAYCYFGDIALFCHVRHLNGNSLDNGINNIALGSASDNELDKPKHVRSNSAKIARSKQGYSGSTRKLSYNDAQIVKKSKESSSVLAERFKVSKSCIQSIKKGLRACYE